MTTITNHATTMRTHYCGAVTEALLGQTVTLTGWVNRRRDHGGVIFIDLRDREGYVQVVCDPDRAETFKVAEDLRNEFCVQLTGLVRARPEGTVNTQITTGNHDTIRSLDNLVDVIDTFLILYLRDDLDVAMMLVQNVLNGLHIGSTTHK